MTPLHVLLRPGWLETKVAGLLRIRIKNTGQEPRAILVRANAVSSLHILWQHNR